MKNCKTKIIGLLAMVLLVSISVSCKKSSDKEIALYQCPMLCEGDKVYDHKDTCPVCKMDLQLKESTVKNEAEIPEMSIFNLPSNWKNQDNEKVSLIDLKGNVLVMVMIYTSCTSACPRLVSDMRNIEKQIPENQKENVKLVFVSIDPLTDTPEKLNAFAKENKMEEDQWVFLTGTEEDTREFAAVLAVSYKQISPMDFSHSNIISVFNTDGVMVHQQEGLGVDNAETVAEIIKQSK